MKDQKSYILFLFVRIKYTEGNRRVCHDDDNQNAHEEIARVRVQIAHPVHDDHLHDGQHDKFGQL